MQDSVPDKKASLSKFMLFFASGGMALLIASMYAIFAPDWGLMFGGIDIFSVLLTTIVSCVLVTLVISWVFKRKGKYFGWRLFFYQVPVLALVTVSLFSWFLVRDHLRIFMNPVAVPSGVRVHHGHSYLFSSYVHLTGPPEAIAAIIESKGLVEVPAEPVDTVTDASNSGEKSKIVDATASNSRERSKDSWDWWEPMSMSKPRFFFRHHESEAVQGWAEGWWVNGSTNEVYAFISG